MRRRLRGVLQTLPPRVLGLDLCSRLVPSSVVVGGRSCRRGN
jgi:hypothetical protein